MSPIGICAVFVFLFVVVTVVPGLAGGLPASPDGPDDHPHPEDDDDHSHGHAHDHA